MGVHVYLVFNGETESALALYKEAFQTADPIINRFNEMPGHEEHIPAGYENGIMHANVEIFGSKVMFSDTLPHMPHTVGNNITVAIVSSEGGENQICF